MPDEQQMMSPEEQRRLIEKALRKIRAGLRTLMRTNTAMPITLGVDEFYAISNLISHYINVNFHKDRRNEQARSKSAITE